MKKIGFSILFIFFVSLYSCNSKQDEESIAYYNLAYTLYQNNSLDSANILIDSLLIKYSTSDKAIFLAKNLKRMIAKDKTMASIDSISEIINEYKIKKIKLENIGAGQSQIVQTQEIIDSLEISKNPFKNIYNHIRTEELTECKQCVTHMRNRRK